MDETVNQIVFIVTISSITGILLIFIVIDLIYVYRKSKLIMEQKLQLEQARFRSELDHQEKLHLQEILDALEKEREKFASDVHDQIGANMSTIKLYFQGIKKMIESGNKQLDSTLKQIDTAIESSSQEIRKISQNIVNGILADFGLVPALQDMSDRINKSDNIKLILAIDKIEDRFPKNIEINVYRIIQELVSNSVKYSEGDLIEVKLSSGENRLEIHYTDNGVGYDPKSVKPGMGLQNIEVRTGFLKGKIEDNSNLKTGVSYLFSIPL